VNDKRRKQIEKLFSDLENVLSCEQAAFDNMPDSIQDSMKGDTMQEGIDTLQEACDLLEGIE